MDVQLIKGRKRIIMRLFKIFLSLSFLIIFQPCIAQEICNNGIDDDGDMLIDLNDDECTCPETRPFSNIKGNICGNGLVLQMEDLTALQHQWYKDGIALTGETLFEITIVEGPNVEGIYQAMATTPTGCYFSEPYDLIVQNYEIYLGEEVICDGESVEFGNFSISIPGFFQNNLIASNGCDSIVSLDVVVIDPVYTDIEDTFCEGQTYILNDIAATEEGMYQSVLPAASGCDSIIRLELTFNEVIEQSFSTVICEDEVYAFGDINATETGQYQTTINSLDACDTLYTIDLEVLSNVETYLDASICQGEEYNEMGIQTSVEGIYQAIFPAANGCDSIVNLALEVLESYTTSINPTICEGDTYVLNDIQTDIAGLYQTNLFATNGCDSIINVDLSVSNVIELQIEEAICAGDVYMLNDIVATMPGEYQTIVNSNTSCDSIIDVTLTVLTPEDLYLSEDICEGETFLYNDIQAMVSGNYETSIIDQNGCSAMMYLELEVLENSESYINEQICIGDTYIYNDIQTSIAGLYQTMVTNAAGCDSMVNIELEVMPLNERYYNMLLCEDEQLNFYGQIIESDGLYEYRFSNPDGCDSLVVVDLEFMPRENLFQVEDYFEVNIGDRLNISPVYFSNNIIRINWMSSNGDLITNAESLYDYLPVNNEQITLLVEDENGCQQIQVIEIRVDVFADIYIPNIINLSSTDNNIFRPYTNNAVGKLLKFDVFDRWGNHIFESDGSIKDFVAWDGHYLDKPVEEGVYTYQMVFELIDGSTVYKAGSVTVLY